MPPKLQLPRGIADEINNGDQKEWRRLHRVNATGKSRKELRKEQRQNKKGRVQTSILHQPPRVPNRPLGRRNDFQRGKKLSSTVKGTSTVGTISSHAASHNAEGAHKASKVGKVAVRSQKPQTKAKFDPEAFLSERHGSESAKYDEDLEYYSKKMGLKRHKSIEEDDGFDELLAGLDGAGDRNELRTTKDATSSGRVFSPARSLSEVGGAIEAPWRGNTSEDDFTDDSKAEAPQTNNKRETRDHSVSSEDEDTGADEFIANPWSDDDSLSESDFTDDTDLEGVGTRPTEVNEASAISSSYTESGGESEEIIENPWSDDDSLSEGDFTEDSDLESTTFNPRDNKHHMNEKETMEALKALRRTKSDRSTVLAGVIDERSGEDAEASEFSESESFSELDDNMTVDETMAALKAAKERKSKLSTNSAAAAVKQTKPKGKENPYLPATKSGKYVPPSQRKQLDVIVETENTALLRRRIKNSLNKLTEDNLGVIVNDIQILYSSSSRNDVNMTVTRVLIESVGSSGTLNESFMIVHAALAAALYKATGVDFGAQFVQSVVEELLESYTPHERDARTSNLLALLVESYMLHITSQRLIYDIIYLLLQEITEFNTELLSLIVRNSGQQLRSDDSATLKNVVVLVQAAVSKLEPGSLTMRTKFLVESIVALKNNRQKGSSVETSATRQRLRKFLGSIKSAGTEPLQVSLSDIKNVKTRGKWWLVGAAWQNTVQLGAEKAPMSQPEDDDNADPALLEDAEPNWLELARRQRLNTDVRRAIFVALMGGEDYLDASQRIDKLRLKKKQEHEIAYVILHCLVQEDVYNPYYALVAGKQVTKHSLRKSFQFALWSYLSQPGSDVAQSSSALKKSMHYARFFAALVSQGVLHLDILKTVDFLTANIGLATFLEVFFISLFQTLAKRAEKAGRRVAGKQDRDARELTQTLASTDNELVLRGLLHILPGLAQSSAIGSSLRARERVLWAIDMSTEVAKQLAQKSGPS